MQAGLRTQGAHRAALIVCRVEAGLWGPSPAPSLNQDPLHSHQQMPPAVLHERQALLPKLFLYVQFGLRRSLTPGSFQVTHSRLLQSPQ